MPLPIYRLPVSTLLEFLEAVSAHSHSDISSIAGFAGFGVTTGRNAIADLEELGLAHRNGGGRIECGADGVRRGMDPAQARLILRRALQAYRPFALICEGLALGESETESLRKAGVILDLHPDDQKKLKILVEWGCELGVMTRALDALCLAAEVAPPTVGEWDVISAFDVESEARARLYVAAKLGREANNFLDGTDQFLLVEAILKYQTESDVAIDNAGQALEDFLREVAEKHGFTEEARKCNGAGQLGSMLVGKGLIHSTHNHLIQALGTARNCVAHKKDKKTLKPWETSLPGAFWAVSGCMVVIHSVYHFVNEGRQTI